MSDDAQAATDAPPKKKGGLAKKLLIVLLLLGLGGGGVYGAMATGLLGPHEAKKEINTPKLVKKGEEDPFAPKKEGGKEGEATVDVEGDGGSQYRTSYFTFAEEFTSNLKGSPALVQMSLACSTRRDGRVLLWLKKHELAIHSTLLAVLADTPEEDVMTIEGKQRLQKRLTAAINGVLIQTEGFGGVDAVYFRSFLVQ